jgi:hypothetical protein
MGHGPPFIHTPNPHQSKNNIRITDDGRKFVKLTDIRIEKDRIRKDFLNIEELAESIYKTGLLEPITVTPKH